MSTKMKLRKLSEEESSALEWWVKLVAEAEVVAGNERAMKSPEGYAKRLAVRLWRQEKILPLVVEEWEWAAREGRLNEPLWPGTLRFKINKFMENVA